MHTLSFWRFDDWLFRRLSRRLPYYDAISRRTCSRCIGAVVPDLFHVKRREDHYLVVV